MVSGWQNDACVIFTCISVNVNGTSWVVSVTPCNLTLYSPSYCSGPSGFMVKDEYDYEGPSSLPSAESHLQTIQHPPSRSLAQEAFGTPALLPPTEASGSAATSSAFSSMSAGSTSKPSRSRQWKCFAMGENVNQGICKECIWNSSRPSRCNGRASPYCSTSLV